MTFWKLLLHWSSCRSAMALFQCFFLLLFFKWRLLRCIIHIYFSDCFFVFPIVPATVFYNQVHDAERVVKGGRWLILMGGDEQEVHHKFKPETTWSKRYESAAPLCSFCVAAALPHPLSYPSSRMGKKFPSLKWKCGECRIFCSAVVWLCLPPPRLADCVWQRRRLSHLRGENTETK